ADDAGSRDVGAQLLGRRGLAVVVVGHHRAAAKAFLGDFGPAHARCPERLHPGAIDSRRQEDLVVDLLEGVEVARIVDVALRVLDDDAQRVAEAAQLAAVLDVVVDVRMAARDHLLEARAEREPRDGERAEQHGDERADHDHRSTVIEDGAFEERTALGLRRLEVQRSGGGNRCVHGRILHDRRSVATPRGPATMTAPVAAPTTAAAGSGRSTLAAAKLAPSSLLTRTCPAWLTRTIRPRSSIVAAVRPTLTPVATLAQVRPPSLLRTTLPRRP